MADIATQAVIAFCALLVVWYVVGWQMNRRRGEQLLGWVLQGLRALGGDQITVSKLGTSGFQVSVAQAQVPFKTIEATILLQPREILVFWIFNLLRGRRDYLVFKAALRAWPRGEVEVMKTGRLSKRVLEELDEKAWTCQETAGGLVMACRGKQDQQQVDAVVHLLESLSPRLLRLSLSKKAPHLLVSLSLAGLDEQSALLLFSSLKDLAQAVTPSGH
jgi:hypothetical protein